MPVSCCACVDESEMSGRVRLPHDLGSLIAGGLDGSRDRGALVGHLVGDRNRRAETQIESGFHCGLAMGLGWPIPRSYRDYI